MDFNYLLILAYPTQLFLFPLLIGWLVFVRDKKIAAMCVLGMAIGSLLLALNGFQISLLSYQNVLGDKTHTLSLIERLKGQMITSQAQIIVVLSLLAILLFVKRFISVACFEKATILFTTGYVITKWIQQKNGECYSSEGFFLFVLVICMIYKKELIKNIHILFPVVSAVVVGISNNQGKLVFARYFIVAFLMILISVKETELEHFFTVLSAIVMIFLLVQGVYANTYQFFAPADNSNYQTEGVLKGISVTDDLGERIQTFKEFNLPDGGDIAIMGNENILYFYGDYIINQPNCISTPVFGESYLNYYNEYGFPTYLVVEKDKVLCSYEECFLNEIQNRYEKVTQKGQLLLLQWK